MGRQLRTSIEIDAPPEDVWEVLVDLQGYRQWNPFIVSAEGEAVPGQRLRLRMRVAGRSHTLRPRVTARDECRVLRWVGDVGVRGLFDAEHTHEVVPTATGTRYVHSERFSGLLVPFLGKTLAATEAAFGAMNRALKQRVESRPASQAPPGRTA